MIIRWLCLIAVFSMYYIGRPALAHGQSLHLIQAADTDDATIGMGAASNVRQVSAYIQSAAVLTKMVFDHTDVIGSQFDCVHIRAALTAVNISSNDTVIFYYSAHGFRKLSDTSRFPRFICSGTAQVAPDGSPDELSLDEVVSLIEQKRPRLLIVVADTCNHVALSPNYFSELIAPTPAKQKTQADKMSDLFITSDGYAIFSSSKAGESSWYQSTGGYFTAKFLSSIDLSTADHGSGTWAEVTSNATQAIWVGQVVQIPIVDDTHLVVSKK